MVSSGPLSNIYKVYGYGRGSGHGWTDQKSRHALALASLEVAIGGARTPLARLQDVWVHAQAHAAACFAPLEARVGKHAVEALLFGRHFHLVRAGHDHR